MRSANHASWVLSLVLCAATATAEAEPRVYVVAVSGHVDLEAATATAGAGARAALQKSRDIEWRGPDQRFLGYDSGALERLEAARAGLDDGKSAYVSFELERAMSLLTETIEAFESAGSVLDRPDELGQALLFLGAAQVLAGDIRSARVTFDRLHTQVPKIRPDLETFPPEVIQAYEEAAPRDRSRPSSTLVIETEPASAVAYVDFVPRGRTPVHVEGLVGGTHFVRVLRPGAAPVVEKASVRRLRSQTVQVSLSPVPGVEGLTQALDQLAEEPAEDEASDAVRNLAAMLELDIVGVIHLSGDAQGEVQLALSFYDAQSGTRMLEDQASGSHAGGTLRSATESLVETSLAAVLSAPADQGQGSVVAEVPKKRKKTKRRGAVYQKWWFWTLVGVAVAGGVTGGVLAAGGRGDDLGKNRGGVLAFDLGPAP